jgi:hypothetical protein
VIHTIIICLEYVINNIGIQRLSASIKIFVKFLINGIDINI